jgi:glycosyltransferase involved in cell wall biosynthesis
MKKKKILLICDDIRMSSGIATVGREIVVGTAKHYDWVNIGGAINHPDKGKVFDLSPATNEKFKINDAYVKIYCVDGYGGPDVLKQVMATENPDALMLFTDPRFWIWIFQMERELRSKIPILYLNIWDCTPAPMYNRSFYESCDLLMAISKQTEQINKFVLGENKYSTIDTVDKNNFKTLIHYVPHGINSDDFFPINSQDHEEQYAKMILRKKELFKDKKYEYVLYYNNRNIRRKQTTDIVLAYKHFVDHLPHNERKKVCLLMHTQPKDENGTDLIAVKEALCPEYDIIFSAGRINPDIMNYQYNIVDVTVNIGSNEGFGLSGAESLMCGTPIINNVTGGLQDHLGFVDENGESLKLSNDFATNHNKKYTKHGKWGIAIYPTSRSVQGSIPTPYISDDRIRLEDLSTAMMAFYKIGREKRKELGKLGREWAMNHGGLNAKNMCEQFIKSVDTTFENWTPRSAFDIIKYEKLNKESGLFNMSKIDDNVVNKLIESFK